jgi:hypothetical protein
MATYRKIEIKFDVYTYNCAICGKQQVRTPIPPTTCAKCGSTHCLSCYARFDTCKPCWKDLTPEGKKTARQQWWAIRKKPVVYTTAIMAPLIVLLITWGILRETDLLTSEGEDILFNVGLFSWLGVIGLVLIGILVKAKKEGRLTVTRPVTSPGPMPKKDKKILCIVLVIMLGLFAFIVAAGMWAYFEFEMRYT